MLDRDKPEVIRRYLDDLVEIRTEHTESAEKCIECDIHGQCTFLSVITVEIVTYERKLRQTA